MAKLAYRHSSHTYVVCHERHTAPGNCSISTKFSMNLWAQAQYWLIDQRGTDLDHRQARGKCGGMTIAWLLGSAKEQVDGSHTHVITCTCWTDVFRFCCRSDLGHSWPRKVPKLGCRILPRRGLLRPGLRREPAEELRELGQLEGRVPDSGPRPLPREKAFGQ